MDERDYYGRRRYPRERFEDDWQTRTYEDEELRQGYRQGAGRASRPWAEEDERSGYGRFPRDEPRLARRRERREVWGMTEGPYDEPQHYGEEPYGPAHSPAHMRGAVRSETGYGYGYGPPHGPAHVRGVREEVGWHGVRGDWDWGAPSEERPWRGERMVGSYAGRGPKGYRRSRERILDDVSERLTRHPEIDASEVEVDVEEDVVILRGRVYDRGQKRMAEDVAESVSGVRDVRNEVEVERGILETLTDAVTGGRSDEEKTKRTETRPRRTSV